MNQLRLVRQTRWLRRRKPVLCLNNCLRHCSSSTSSSKSTKKKLREISNPKRNRALVFPGQSFQYVGMLRDWHAEYPSVTNQTMDDISEVIGSDIRNVIYNEKGESDRELMRRMTLTKHAQILVFTHTLTILNVMRKEHGIDVLYPSLSKSDKKEASMKQYLIGHSSGEWTALYGCGLFGKYNHLDIADCLYQRSLFMSDCCSDDQSMVTLMKYDESDIDEVIHQIQREMSKDKSDKSTDKEKKSVIAVSNRNSPISTVISGHSWMIDMVLSKLKQTSEIKDKAKKTRGGGVSKKVDSEGAFHSGCMTPANQKMYEYLTRKIKTHSEFRLPLSNESSDIIFNLSGTIMNNHCEMSSEEFSQMMSDQIDHCVQFSNCVYHGISEHNVNEFIMIGPKSRSLSNLIQQTHDYHYGDKSKEKSTIDCSMWIDKVSDLHTILNGV